MMAKKHCIYFTFNYSCISLHVNENVDHRQLSTFHTICSEVNGFTKEPSWPLRTQCSWSL